MTRLFMDSQPERINVSLMPAGVTGGVTVADSAEQETVIVVHLGEPSWTTN